MFDYLEFTLLPVMITFALTWIIGFERQNIGKSAGISPHVLISVTSCCLALLQQSIEGGDAADGQRLIGQLITGVGFLGAGVIMKSHRNVKGLTTATSLFASAIIGVIIGTGHYDIGFTLGVIVIVFLYGRDIKRRVNPFRKHIGERDDVDE